MEKIGTKGLKQTRFSRARGYYLYSTEGRRYRDMYLSSGQAPLGHRMKGMRSSIKQIVEKGLLSNVENREKDRCKTVLRRCFPRWKLCGWYYVASDELLPSMSETEIPIFRPYLGNQTEPNVMFFVLPRGRDPLVLPLLSQDEDITFPALCVGIDVVTHTKVVLFRVESASPVEYRRFRYAVELLSNVGICRRPFPKQEKNRADLYAIECAQDAQDLPKKGKYMRKEIPLPVNWRRMGIYISPPPMEVRAYCALRELFFEHRFFVPPKGYPWVLPPTITKSELHSWEHAIRKGEKG